MNQRAGPNILWGITASVAAIRAESLAEALLPIGSVQAVVTERAKHFLEDLPDEIVRHDDAAEWAQWSRLGDPVLHIELRRWADCLLIAPLSADGLAKVATGICDSLLYSVARAWDFSKPVVVAPAMNTKMWEHPVTGGHLATLRSWGVTVIDPISKALACADVGIGAMETPEAIAAALRKVADR